MVDMRSLIAGFGESCTIVHRTTLHNQVVCSQMCPIDIFVDLQLIGKNLKRGLIESPVWG